MFCNLLVFQNFKFGNTFRLFLFLSYLNVADCLLECSGNISDTENAALYKPARQSSTFMSTNPGEPSGHAYQANDGNHDPDYNHGSCSHTVKEIDPIPWWMVDLGQTYMITSVIITNRDRFPERLRNLHIDLADTDAVGSDGLLEGSRLCFYFTANNAGAGETIEFVCNPYTYGRYLRISIIPNDLLKPLAPCEIEAIGYPTNCTYIDDTTTSTPQTEQSSSILFTTSDSYITTKNTQSFVNDTSPTATSENGVTTTGFFNNVSTSPGDLTASTAVNDVTTMTTDRNIESSSSSSTVTMCECSCKQIHNNANVSITLEESLDKIKKELTVDRKDTSLFKRTLISADDDRVSARNIGYVGVAVLVLVFGGIIIFDLPLMYTSLKDLLHFLRHLKNNGL